MQIFFRPTPRQHFAVPGHYKGSLEIQSHRKSSTPGHWFWLADSFSWALFARWCYLLWHRVWWKLSKDFYCCYSGLFFPHKAFMCGNICQILIIDRAVNEQHCVFSVSWGKKNLLFMPPAVGDVVIEQFYCISSTVVWPKVNSFFGFADFSFLLCHFLHSLALSLFPWLSGITNWSSSFMWFAGMLVAIGFAMLPWRGVNANC